jgi:hypothetical protein
VNLADGHLEGRHEGPGPNLETITVEGGKLVFEYRIVKSNTHYGLEEEINKAAVEGWEPMFVYAWNTAPNTADHAVLLRRPR